MKSQFCIDLVHLFFKWCKKARNGFVAAFLIVAYHWYDALCYAISNMFGHVEALVIMSLILFFLSLVFVYLHSFLNGKYSWDMLELEQLNRLKDDDSLPSYRIFKRLLRQMMIKGYWWIYFIGPWTVGPFLVAILLRKNNGWKENLRYIIPGTMISVIFWVSIWSGVGIVTWNQFVKPFFKSLIQ